MPSCKLFSNKLFIHQGSNFQLWYKNMKQSKCCTTIVCTKHELTFACQRRVVFKKMSMLKFNIILYCTCIIFLKFYEVFKIRILWLKILQLWCLRDSWVKSDRKSGQLPQSHQSLKCGRSNSNEVDVVILSFTFFSSHYTRCSAHFTISLILPPPPLTRSLPNTFFSHYISFTRGLITPTTSSLLL